MKLNVLAVLLIVMPGTTMAGVVRDNAWFSLEGSSDPSVTALGGPGQTLVIEKPLGPGVSTLTIGFNVSLDHQYGSPTSLANWGFELSEVDANGTQVVSFDNPDFTAGVGGSYDTPLGTDDAGGGGFGAEAQDSSGTGLAGLLFEFDITIGKPDTGGTMNIFGSLRDMIATQTGFWWYGYLGPNPGQYGVDVYSSQQPLPLITINNVPEPLTIVLLGVGTVLLLRGRRRDSRA